MATLKQVSRPSSQNADASSPASALQVSVENLTASGLPPIANNNTAAGGGKQRSTHAVFAKYAKDNLLPLEQLDTLLSELNLTNPPGNPALARISNGAAALSLDQT